MRTSPYPHDRLLAATILKLVPPEVRPNQLTVLRILATPFVAWTIYLEEYVLGVAFFLLVALTDALDGSLARTRGQVTDWGAAWDPVADKLLIGSIAVLLLFRHFPPELTVAILGVEAVFLVAGYYRKRQGRIVSANWWGKIKMLLQVLGLTLFLLWLAGGGAALATASYIVLVVATLCAFGSLFSHGA